MVTLGRIQNCDQITVTHAFINHSALLTWFVFHWTLIQLTMLKKPYIQSWLCVSLHYGKSVLRFKHNNNNIGLFLMFCFFWAYVAKICHDKLWMAWNTFPESETLAGFDVKDRNIMNVTYNGTGLNGPSVIKANISI